MLVSLLERTDTVKIVTMRLVRAPSSTSATLMAINKNPSVNVTSAPSSLRQHSLRRDGTCERMAESLATLGLVELVSVDVERLSS